MVPLLMFLNATAFTNSVWTQHDAQTSSATRQIKILAVEAITRSRKQIGIISGLEEVQAQEFDAAANRAYATLLRI